MQFHTMLKKSITITYTKLRVLSKAVGVDPSYLSRFSNGLILPSAQITQQLMIDLGKFFFQYKEVKDEFNVDTEEELIDLFRESMNKSIELSQPKMKFKEAELTDYLSLMIELREVLDVLKEPQVLLSLPNTLETMVQSIIVDADSIEHSNSFIYVKDVVYYALHPFENFQKVMVTRFSQPNQLKEIEMCLE